MCGGKATDREGRNSLFKSRVAEEGSNSAFLFIIKIKKFLRNLKVEYK